MMAQQQFMLKWNNHLSNLSEVFNNMLVSENLVDVTIACEGASLKAHKMILSACSPFFQSLFMTNPCKHPIVILKDVRFIDLKAIIDFMYSGEVNVNQDQLTSLLKTAETLKVKGLAEVTEKQARSQPAFSGSPSYSKPKRRRGRDGLGKSKDGSCQTSESEDDSGVKRFHASRLGTQREKERQMIDQQKQLLQTEVHLTQSQLEELGHGEQISVQGQENQQEQADVEEEKIGERDEMSEQEQIAATESISISSDASKILEQSIANAVDLGSADNMIVATDVQDVHDEQDVHDVAEAVKQIPLFGDTSYSISADDSGQFSLATPVTPSNSSSSLPHQGRRLMMSDSHKAILKDYLDKPIHHFDVIIDDWKKSIVWQYFGGLVYKNPNGTVNVIDNERHYCLRCIMDCIDKNPGEIFERCNICFLSTGTATGNHKNHLRHRHQICDDTVQASTSKQSGSKQPSKVIRKRSTKVISISLDSYN